MAGRIEKTVERLDWAAMADSLGEHGYAPAGQLLSPDECDDVAGWFDDDDRFRSHIVMARHGFGRGEYKYFSYPLPPVVQALRAAVYPKVAAIANDWAQRLGTGGFPETLEDMLARCHEAGQLRPTPLLLRYGADDYNCLHQDLYGEHVFPIQLAVLLNQPGEDFEGGEFVLTEQRPRMQSRAEVVPLRRGEGVLFAVSHRPKHGTRGVYRVNMRHGVSRLRSGRRHTLGVIFHDAA
jgi:hypothetical protein